MPQPTGVLLLPLATVAIALETAKEKLQAYAATPEGQAAIEAAKQDTVARIETKIAELQAKFGTVQTQVMDPSLSTGLA